MTLATPPMDQNLKELLFALNKHHVKSVIIGGYAVFVHAQPRMTKDMDISLSNQVRPTRLRLSKALAESGAPLSEFTVEDFILRLFARSSGIHHTVLTSCNKIAGVDFASVYHNSEELLIDGEFPVRYISAADLITNTLASGRLQDLADVEAIRHRQRAVKEGSSN